jgi:hypothetical protein
MASFIDDLPISGPDKRKLKQLGTDTPFGLLSLIQAAPNEFNSLMGDSAGIVREQVEELVPASRRSVIGTVPELALGAQLAHPPRVQQPTDDIGLRDRLFDEWRSLLKDPVTWEGKRAKELEAQLNALMERWL